MNYYKRHIGDYAAATRHLSLLEHGAYTMMLDLYYGNEKPLPADEKAVQRLVGARSKDEREAVSLLLNEFFELQDDGWHQSRCDEEITKKQEKTETNRAVGMLGGRPKKVTQTLDEKEPSGFGKETQTVSENNPSHKPLTNSQEKERERAPARSVRHPRETPIPDSFAVSDAVRKWAAGKGIDPDPHLEPFIAKCRAKGYRYVDWDRAFQEAIRNDWAGMKAASAAVVRPIWAGAK